MRLSRCPNILTPLFLCPAFMLAFLVVTATANAETLTVEHQYVLGDFDTRSDARTVCMAECRKKLAEKAGVLVESEVETLNYVLTREQVNAYAAALVKIISVEDIHIAGKDHFALKVVVTAEVDREGLQKGIRKIHSNTDLSAQVDRQYREIDASVARIGELRKAESVLGSEQKDAYMREKRVLAQSLESLEVQHERILDTIAQKSTRTEQFVDPGMTRDEVRSFVGKPRAVRNGTNGFQCEKYGDVWVVYKDGLVMCLRSRLEYKKRLGGECHCSGMFTTILKK